MKTTTKFIASLFMALVLGIFTVGLAVNQPVEASTDNLFYGQVVKQKCTYSGCIFVGEGDVVISATTGNGTYITTTTDYNGSWALSGVQSCTDYTVTVDLSGLGLVVVAGANPRTMNTCGEYIANWIVAKA
jgi:hypothetical protein